MSQRLHPGVTRGLSHLREKIQKERISCGDRNEVSFGHEHLDLFGDLSAEKILGICIEGYNKDLE